MILTRYSDRRVASRLKAVDGFHFPASVRQRLGHQHADLSADDLRLAEDATRQWFRLLSRHPGRKLSMPSVIVDDVWHELVLHTRDYAAFCDAAFGRFLHHEPESAMGTDAAYANRTTLLLATLNLARRDEGCKPGELPLLFRVDRELRIQGAKRYLVDCGGRGECFEATNMVCLQHLGGAGKRVRDRGVRGFVPLTHGGEAGSGASGGFGCSGGGDSS